MRRSFMAALVALAPVAAMAAQATPDWPCIQPRQPHLSLGQVWTGPQPDAGTEALAASTEIAALADRLAQRRLPVADAEAEIAAFAEGRDPAARTALMQALFERIDRQRSLLMDGISRYGHKQVALAAQVQARRARMATLEAADKPDFDAIDAEEKALDWDQRVFTDRQQSLTYVCETPVILEQRLFALGRALAAGLPPE